MKKRISLDLNGIHNYRKEKICIKKHKYNFKFIRIRRKCWTKQLIRMVFQTNQKLYGAYQTTWKKTEIVGTICSKLFVVNIVNLIKQKILSQDFCVFSYPSGVGLCYFLVISMVSYTARSRYEKIDNSLPLYTLALCIDLFLCSFESCMVLDSVDSVYTMDI